MTVQEKPTDEESTEFLRNHVHTNGAQWEQSKTKKGTRQNRLQTEEQKHQHTQHPPRRCQCKRQWFKQQQKKLENLWPTKVAGQTPRKQKVVDQPQLNNAAKTQTNTKPGTCSTNMVKNNHNNPAILANPTRHKNRLSQQQTQAKRGRPLSIRTPMYQKHCQTFPINRYISHVDWHLRGYKNNQSNTKQSQQQGTRGFGHTTWHHQNRATLRQPVRADSILDQKNSHKQIYPGNKTTEYNTGTQENTIVSQPGKGNNTTTTTSAKDLTTTTKTTNPQTG